MSVQFSYGDLFVGIHGVNFTRVYYKPRTTVTDNEDAADNEEAGGNSKGPDDRKAPDCLLFEKPRAKPSLKNPIAGEVFWLPHFDPTKFIADTKPEKVHLQRWFLFRCWDYLHAKDQVGVQESVAANQFAGRNDRRWDTREQDAKKWRRKKSRGEIRMLKNPAGYCQNTD